MADAERKPGDKLVTWGPVDVVGRPPSGTFTRAREPEASVFLAALAEGHSPTGAARLARISRSQVTHWRDTDPVFAECWAQAYQAGTEFMEEEAHRRAVFGTEEPVWYQGVQVGTVRKPSDRLMELMLKARAPEKYRERVDVQHTAVPLSPEQLQAARAAALSPEVEAAQRVIASLPVVEGTARET